MGHFATTLTLPSRDHDSRKWVVARIRASAWMPTTTAPAMINATARRQLAAPPLESALCSSECGRVRPVNSRTGRHGEFGDFALRPATNSVKRGSRYCSWCSCPVSSERALAERVRAALNRVAQSTSTQRSLPQPSNARLAVGICACARLAHFTCVARCRGAVAPERRRLCHYRCRTRLT